MSHRRSAEFGRRAGHRLARPQETGNGAVALSDAGTDLPHSRPATVGVRSAWRRRHARHRSVDRRDGQRRHHRIARGWGAVRNACRCGQGRLAANPAKGVENLPRKTAKRHVYLSADDVHRLADESGAHRALVLTLAYTDIRWGEAVALRVRDVEFLRRRLAVSENAVQLGTRHAVGPNQGPQSALGPGARVRARRAVRPMQGQGARRSPSLRAATAAICRGQSRRPDGSRLRSNVPGCRPSRRTTCSTPAPVSRSAPGSMCLRCNACLGTLQRR